MTRVFTIVAFSLCFVSSLAAQEKKAAHTSFEYTDARKHELEPHRRTVPMDGIEQGFNQLHLTLVVSPAGDVVEAKASAEDKLMAFWPELEGEVRGWKFSPFEKDGKAVTAEVEEYLDLVPPERLPERHVPPPVVRDDSKVEITLRRTGCYGSCPSYSVTVSDTGILFDGDGFVVAEGQHRAAVAPEKVRELARQIVKADFYSMDKEYFAGVTDNPTYSLKISIDGNEKEVVDYVGSWVGMPAVISQLENEVDQVARTEQWIRGSDGLAEELAAEKYNFKTYQAQVMLKAAAQRGQAETVRALLEGGVSLKQIPAPKPKDKFAGIPFENVGWLTAASESPEVLQILIDAEASKNDQADKNLALAGAARAGKVEAVRELLGYGANPNADLRKLTVKEDSGSMSVGEPGAGSILIYAAGSGNPEMVAEILRYHPKLEARDGEGKTAIFAAGESESTDVDGARVACVQMLAKAGANVNARDNDGNTPLHETFLTDVEEALLKLGADVNARNKDGETPIFTTVDDDAIPLFLAHGADLAIRNKKGQTVVEAAAEKGPLRQEALRKAIEKSQNQ